VERSAQRIGFTHNEPQTVQVGLLNLVGILVLYLFLNKQIMTGLANGSLTG
jgi:hypothetical protein